MQEVAKLREISFYYKFIEKYSCRYEKTKVYYNAKFRVHNVGLLHDGRPEEKSNESEPIKHSITVSVYCSLISFFGGVLCLNMFFVFCFADRRFFCRQSRTSWPACFSEISFRNSKFHSEENYVRDKVFETHTLSGGAA